jgi:hypothetical protein
MKEWKKILQINAVQKQEIWWSRFQGKIRRQKESRFVLIKETIHQEDVTIIPATNINTANFIKQTLLDIKVQIDNYIIRVWDFNTQFFYYYY